ncbi:tectonin beta-propeller repeat-containing protein 1-like isoform X1 [Pseudonaja textilis]|uniref:tectonin beta-propeller repeat-containing protein 1-like isoform X1 n=1 Tax=Pseudonaja textilis TaxID=8673 RepID=UPI000EA8472A|nr:tectonin beta-propeller repeat-containing protein 1-like isoform X1 [Pseudonaja textilis]
MWKAIACNRESDRSQTGSSTSLLSAGCFFTDDIKEQNASVFQSDGESESHLNDAPLPGLDPETLDSPHPVPELDMDPLATVLEEAAAGSDRDHQAGPDKPPSNLDSLPPKPQWTNIDLKEASRMSKATVLQDKTPSLSSFLPAAVEDHFATDDLPLWIWVSSRGCLVDSQSPLKWFTAQSALTSCAHSLALSISPSHTAQWRKQIVRQLSERTHRELDNFRHYEQAVEQVKWGKGRAGDGVLW